jgi:prepilin peptidase CpaA
MMNVLPAIAVLWGVGLIDLAAAATIDFRKRIIPNRLVLVMAGIGLALRLAAAAENILLSLLGAGAVLLCLGALARHQIVGGGDAKLIAAVTLLVSPAGIPRLLFAISLAGGLLGCLYLCARLFLNRVSPAGGSGKDPGHAKSWLSREMRRVAAGEPMPYALAVLGGVVWSLAWGAPGW